ncbi:leucine-rich repeat, immunoglobulin-like domain and transmembrane domain-containing protein 1 [Ornithorhynchus anatinus]|uniref:leucine-rich repeat, immunoglobulin-like domain and transmembrane domain-containing protein 1 n=1 Tax=Ornithorhynchus anatinus TaxID=9258 RepID=UPI0010A8E59A|nr:leucine-rich repeat, immunoglobulin-like domain and transmembrane domain-containing protein 1 [Ornithorhynchus anatinus]
MWLTGSLFFCCLALGGLPKVHCSCPLQCSCIFHSLSDGTKARTVLCNDPELTLMPVAIPSDTQKLRIEKTSIRWVPEEVFNGLSHLEYLWLPYNSLASFSPGLLRGLRQLRELRLGGNHLVSFPWEALGSTPQLSLLDLRGNLLPSVPGEAARFIGNLTYLDLSSNRLKNLPQELIATWSNLQAAPHFPSDNSKVILGLQDNPWVCDCSLYEMVHFLNFQPPHLAFIESRLKCFTPWSLAGVTFSQVKLKKCQSPRVHTSVAKVKTVLGSPVWLRCGTSGVPVPELSWRRVDGHQLSGTVHQEISSDGMSWSVLGLPVVSYGDSGEYVCQAENPLGVAEAFISLIIIDAESPWGPSGSPQQGRLGGSNALKAASFKDKLVAGYVLGSPSLPTPVFRTLFPVPARDPEPRPSHGSSPPDLEAPQRAPGPGPPHERAGVTGVPPPSRPATQPELERTVRSVKVIGDTHHSVSLAWKPLRAGPTATFNVLYAVFGERDMRRISVGPGKTRVTIDGLTPQTKYIACVCLGANVPRKEQCVIFSTDEAASAGGTQKLINVVVVSVACVIAVPLTLMVCCGALRRRCRKCFTREPEGPQDAYGTFETLSPGALGNGDREGGGGRRGGGSSDEANRLLSARTSVDSQAGLKGVGPLPPNGHIC